MIILLFLLYLIGESRSGFRNIYIFILVAVLLTFRVQVFYVPNGTTLEIENIVEIAFLE